MFSTGQKSQDVLEYLQTRRSCSLKLMGESGPSRNDIGQILKIATRIPDHGKLTPWRFIVFDGQARSDIGSVLREAYKIEDPEASEAKLDLEAERFLRAPVVILTVSSISSDRKPEWEQILSAGAACYNLCLAANALGYGTSWLTEWYSYNEVFKKSIGLEVSERIAGAIYIGSVESMPEERDRPDVSDIMTFWLEQE